MTTVSRGRTSQRYQFIERNRQNFKVNYLCKWLNVSRSGYYDWRNRGVSNREKENQELMAIIKCIYDQSRGTYGSPRIHQALLQQGYNVGKKRVEHLMHRQQLQGKVVKVTRRQPGLKRFKSDGKNLRLNQPQASGNNQVWVADITYLKVKKDWLYLSVVMDIYSRRILGWSLSKTRTTALTITILRHAMKNRKRTEPIIFHTDRGIEYTAHKYQDYLRNHQMKSSLNRMGHCTQTMHIWSHSFTV